jgi:co-chaperonin GroES (HSP10)
MKEVNIQPLGSLILVEEMQAEDLVTQSGLVLSAVTADLTLNKGVVVKLGTGEPNPYTGSIMPIEDIEVGSIVYYSPNNATEIKDNAGNQFYFVNSKMLFGYEK